MIKCQTPASRRDVGPASLIRFLAFALLCPIIGSAQEATGPSPLAQGVDRIFRPLVQGARPGCAVGVIREGAYVHTGAYGLANLEYGIPLTTRSVFRTGSLSKQFTAMAIAILAERGQLSLDADPREYLPGLAQLEHQVSIRQMLHHTAGMGDYGDSPELFTNADGGEFRWGNEDYLSTPEFLEKVLVTPLVATPGTEFRYSNFAYFLLGQVVEAVSGMSLRQFAQREIFGPLSMRDSQFNDDVNRVVRNLAYGYRKNASGDYEVYMTNLDWVGDGGVYTNIDDFLHWDGNFYANRLGRGDQSLVDLMQTPGPIARQEPGEPATGYGFGLEIDRYRGRRRIAHSGSWVAFTSYYARFPELRLSAVTFCNAEDASAVDLGKRVADLALDLLASAPPNEPLIEGTDR